METDNYFALQSDHLLVALDHFFMDEDRRDLTRDKIARLKGWALEGLAGHRFKHGPEAALEAIKSLLERYKGIQRHIKKMDRLLLPLTQKAVTLREVCI